MKIYYKIILTIVLLSAEFGFLLPWMISYPDDFLAFGGIVLGLISLPLYYTMWKREIKKIK